MNSSAGRSGAQPPSSSGRRVAPASGKALAKTPGRTPRSAGAFHTPKGAASSGHGPGSRTAGAFCVCSILVVDTCDWCHHDYAVARASAREVGFLRC
jgi:hypothetical protein